MSYGDVKTKCTIKTNRFSASLRGEGSVYSNDLQTEERLAAGLASSIDHTVELAYEAHIRRMRK
jgi:hypothetical protein